jgi:hypothetical protein
VYGGGEKPKFEGCGFEYCNIILDGAAGRTVDIIREFYRSGAAEAVRGWLPELFGILPPDYD